MKIAVTSTDGKTVNQHFGKATEFYIYDFEFGALTFLEKRDVAAYCNPDPNHEFDGDKLKGIIEMIKDCPVIYTAKIGDAPKEKLLTRGFDVQTCTCAIESIGSCGHSCGCDK